MYMHINMLEKDLLKEIFNIGVSKAADAFSMLLKNRKAIMLTVPDVKVVSPQELPAELSEFEDTKLAIKSKLEGDLTGLTIMLFYEEQMDWIIKNSMTEKEMQHKDFSLLRLSLLLEMSNILTGAILTQFSNILEMDIHGMPPVCITPGPEESIESIVCDIPPCQPIVLSVKTDFLDQNRVIELPLLIVLDISSLSTILNTIRQKGLHDQFLLKANYEQRPNSV